MPGGCSTQSPAWKVCSPRPQRAHGLEAVRDHVAVELHAIAVGIAEIHAARHVVLDGGLDGDAELAELAVRGLQLGEAADLPRHVMQARLLAVGRLTGGQLEERELVVFPAEAEEHRAVLQVLVRDLETERARVEVPGCAGVTNLEHEVTELARLDHRRVSCAGGASGVDGPPHLLAGASILRAMSLADSGALRGRVAIITGAATGIGRASALLFARAGAAVAIVDVREPELARTEADVRAAGREVTAGPADLAEPGRRAAAGPPPRPA